MEPILVDVDVELLLKRVSETWDPVVERHGPDREHGLVQNGEGSRVPPIAAEGRRGLPQAEPLCCQESSRPCLLVVKLMDLDGEWIAVDEVPRIAPELARHVGNEPGWPIEPERLAAAKRNS